MKTLKLAFTIIAFVFLACNYGQGQPVSSTITVTIDPLYYGPGIGTVYGTYTYHFSYKLDKEGNLKGIQWNVIKSDLKNTEGDNVIMVDSGHDTKGDLWIWFNYPNYLNHDVYECPEINYSVEDGWLDYLYPVELPKDGVAVEMSCKVLCKGQMFKLQYLAVFHLNANGVAKVDLVKP